MYKIRFLFIMLLGGLGVAYAQRPGQQPTLSTQRSTQPISLSKLLSHVANTVQNSRPTVFTGHPLANPVDLGRKHTFDTLTGDQPASLSCPIPYQTPFR